MDNTTGLEEAALRIRNAIDHFATTKSWARNDYYIRMIANIVWPAFLVTICARDYNSPHINATADYNEVYEHLEKELKDEPELYEATSVLLAGLHFIYSKLPTVGENYIQFDASLLNPGWVDPKPLSQVTQRN